MKFKNLEQLIKFEDELQWINEELTNVNNYKFSEGIQTKYDSLKGKKVLGINGNEIVSVVSDKFSPISVREIANACDKSFGSEYQEKSFREGIVRIYETGVEDTKGKVTPLVVYPANLGNMAVRIGLHHNAFVCSNGLIIADGLLSQRIVHRSTINDLDAITKSVSDNAGLILQNINAANETELNSGLQLAMIIQGLDYNDSLVNKALSKYAPQAKTLWSTIQAITYVSTHETKNGFTYAKNAGNYLFSPKLENYELLSAASYAYTKEQKGAMNFENSNALYAIAKQIL